MDEEGLFESGSKEESSTHGWMRDGTFTKKSRLSKSGESDGDRGILNNAYGPRDGSSYPVKVKQSSWFTKDAQNGDGDDTQSRPRTMMSVRPVTAMSQVGDFIPSLEDLNLVEETSHAPQVAVNTLASYQDLEHDRARHLLGSAVNGIDISLLVGRILPERELIEKDEPWTWNELISNISSRLQAQSEEDSELNLLTVVGLE